jgi:hypothetical protein
MRIISITEDVELTPHPLTVDEIYWVIVVNNTEPFRPISIYKCFCETLKINGGILFPKGYSVTDRVFVAKLAAYGYNEVRLL